MVSVDTNVLVRVFVDDQSDRDQITKVRQAVGNYDRIYVSQVVQIETFWVLQSLYDFAKAQLIEVCEHLISNRAFVLENRKIFEEALSLYRDTNADFPDLMILVTSRRKGCSLLTFDKKLLRLDGTERIG